MFIPFFVLEEGLRMGNGVKFSSILQGIPNVHSGFRL